MKVSTREQYGLRAMAELAARYGDGAVALGEVAQAQGLPLPYLEQIVPALRAAGLIKSRRGAHGGYELTRPPATITVGEVLRALSGDILPVRCVSERGGHCARSSLCTARTVWEAVQRRLVETLDTMTLADLLTRED